MMIKLNYNDYKDKVYACWLGKNIGGTLGTPYEGARKRLNVTGFVTPPKEPLPNDDLDLQLLWLHAIRSEGAKDFNAEILGTYWQTYVVQHWNEYGICQANMKKGLYPSISGNYKNPWKHSNGAWIRTEIWATLAPASPDLAVAYAIEDAKIDHGDGEGTYAAMFVAALESSAFVISEPRKLIDIGLSKIPSDCRMAKTIRLILKSYDEGVSYEQVRELVFEENADIGDGWFQAPTNVGYAIIGLLYGEGDFKKSMLLAVNCGDDTDCTAATIGSIMGLIYGTKVLPKDWIEYVSEKIVTCTVATLFEMPKNCQELTDWVVDFAPAVLIENRANVRIVESETQIEENLFEKLTKQEVGHEWDWDRDDERTRQYYAANTVNSFSIKSADITAVISYDGEPEIKPNQEKKIKLKLINNAHVHGNAPRNVIVKAIVIPDGFTIDKEETSLFIPQFTMLTKNWMTDIELAITAGEKVKATNRVLIEVNEPGRYNSLFIPIVFLG